MNRASIAAILAAVGIMLHGPLTGDAVALARAIDSGDTSALLRFSEEFPQSQLAPRAIELAENQNDRGTDSNRGQGVGGSGPGNQGNDKEVGNAGYKG